MANRGRLVREPGGESEARLLFSKLCSAAGQEKEGKRETRTAVERKTNGGRPFCSAANPERETPAEGDIRL